MDTFRAAVKDKLGASVPDTPVEPEQPGGKIKAGALVTITGTKYYGGQIIPAWVRKQKWYVYEVSGDVRSSTRMRAAPTPSCLRCRSPTWRWRGARR